MANDAASVNAMIPLAQGGDRVAREHLFERLLLDVRHVVALRMHRPIGVLLESEDLVQEAMLDVVCELAGYRARGERALHRWLERIVERRLQLALGRQIVRARWSVSGAAVSIQVSRSVSDRRRRRPGAERPRTGASRRGTAVDGNLRRRR